MFCSSYSLSDKISTAMRIPGLISMLHATPELSFSVLAESSCSRSWTSGVCNWYVRSAIAKQGELKMNLVEHLDFDSWPAMMRAPQQVPNPKPDTLGPFES